MKSLKFRRVNCPDPPKTPPLLALAVVLRDLSQGFTCPVLSFSVSAGIRCTQRHNGSHLATVCCSRASAKLSAYFRVYFLSTRQSTSANSLNSFCFNVISCFWKLSVIVNLIRLKMRETVTKSPTWTHQNLTMRYVWITHHQWSKAIPTLPVSIATIGGSKEASSVLSLPPPK